MKSKTSITLSKALLDDIDQHLGAGANRSKLIEAAVREYLERRGRELRDKQELELLNRNASSLNREAKDVLSFQVKL